VVSAKAGSAAISNWVLSDEPASASPTFADSVGVSEAVVRFDAPGFCGDTVVAVGVLGYELYVIVSEGSVAAS
jgi:hypothetical protein